MDHISKPALREFTVPGFTPSHPGWRVLFWALTISQVEVSVGSRLYNEMVTMKAYNGSRRKTVGGGWVAAMGFQAEGPRVAVEP